ncbi:M90 family metallopeptidase [Hydrogenophaga sp. 5NK40-0174]|uniref:M90 family metallopeptidase n=1 Tax=Hydrogenophaga sp. 5NK40-0174 TaxID=3127649 RepID=UPI003108CC17
MIRRIRRWVEPWLPRAWRKGTPIPDSLWRRTVASLPFLESLNLREQNKLHKLCAHFLQEKEFHGAHGLEVTDEMAMSVAAQACLPLLHIAMPDGRKPPRSASALEWYDDFVGIVLQPGAALARRETRDAAGVVHQYEEALAGEAMDRGPVMLSWDEVSKAADLASSGRNVVIHEFVHKIDMRGMAFGSGADGAPPLHTKALGSDSIEAAQAHWRQTMSRAYNDFQEAVARAERFGQPAPWLDPYGAKAPAEFFAVCAEAFFVQPEAFAIEFPAVHAMFDAFFRPLARTKPLSVPKKR